jgi:hypothetical protein
LSDLILKNNSELISMPWVNHKSRKWEIEPFRWLGINSTLQLARFADFVEKKIKKETIITKLLNLLQGH